MTDLLTFVFCLVPFALLLGWLADAYDELSTTVRCACGRREMRDVLCSPQDRPALARELTSACPMCTPPIQNRDRQEAGPSVASSLGGSVAGGHHA